MDFETLRKKLIRNGFSKTGSFVLIAVTVVFLILGFVNQWAGTQDPVPLSDSRKDVGAYAYTDAVAFDEWVCKYGDDTYYVLYDGSGNVYLAVISDRVMNRMTREAAGSQDYQHYFDGSYRLNGLVKKTGGKVVSFVEEAYGISGSEYASIFGPCYFDTTDTPNGENAAMWFTFALFSGLFAVILTIIWVGSERPFNRECRDYSDEEYAEAGRLLDGADRKQDLIFGEELLISRNNGVLVRYGDILWMHLVDTSYNGVRLGRMVRVHTRKRNSFKLSPAHRDSEEELDEIMNTVLEKNPEILIGYTKENQQAYDAMTKE